MSNRFRRNKNIMFRTRKQADHVQVKKFTVVLIICVLAVLALSLFSVLHGNNISSTFGADTAAQTKESVPEQTDIASISGKYTLLMHCENDKGELYFIWLAQMKMPECALKVCSVPVKEAAELNGETRTLQDIYKLYGDRGLMQAVSKVCGVEIDRYAGSVESGLKTMISSLGGVDVELEEQIKYKSSDFDLVLSKGEHSLKGDTYFKYFKYLGTLGDEGADKECELIVSTFKSVFRIGNASKSGKIFSNLSNTIDTNISIVDYTTREAMIDMLMNNGIKSSNTVEDYREFAKE